VAEEEAVREMLKPQMVAVVGEAVVHCLEVSTLLKAYQLH
jgi:hypothetical protein